MFGGIGTCRQTALSYLRKGPSGSLTQSRICPAIGRYAPHHISFISPLAIRKLTTTPVLHKKTTKKNQSRERSTGDPFRDLAFAKEDIDPDDFFYQEELRFEREIREAEKSQEAGEGAREEGVEEGSLEEEKEEEGEGMKDGGIELKPEDEPEAPPEAQAETTKSIKKKIAKLKERGSIEPILEKESGTATGEQDEGVMESPLRPAKPAKVKSKQGERKAKQSSKKEKKEKKKTKEPKPESQPRPRGIGRPRTSPKQKEINKKRKQLKLIRELRKLALKPPKKLPETAQRQFVKAMQTNDFHSAYEAQAKLSPKEQQALEDRVVQNRETNAKNLREWILTLTPLQVKQANSARRKLGRLLGKPRLWLLHDDRVVSRPLDAWKVFVKEKNSTRGENESVLEMTQRISREWKNLTPEQREKYENIGQKDFERYVKEYREVYGEEPPKTTGKTRKYQSGKESLSKEGDQQTANSEST